MNAFRQDRIGVQQSDRPSRLPASPSANASLAVVLASGVISSILSVCVTLAILSNTGELSGKSIDSGEIVVGSRDQIRQLERSNVTLANRLTRLEANHSELRNELSLVSGPKGVLAGIISQLRILKGQGESLRRDVVDVVRGDGSHFDPNDLYEAEAQSAELMQPAAMAPASRSGYTEVTPTRRPEAKENSEGGKSKRVKEDGE